MQADIFSENSLPPSLARGIFAARSNQFVDRLGWDLCVDAAGQERDQYDDAHAMYAVVRKDDRHLLSCRLRPATCGTMLEECFPNTFKAADGFVGRQRRTLWELTRFCRAPDISVSDSAKALKAMSYVLDDLRDTVGVSGFIAVVYPHFPRFLNRIGTRYLVLDDGVVDGKKCNLLCITHAVDHRARKDALSAQTSSQRGLERVA